MDVSTNVLVVDDEEDFCAFIREYLEQRKYNVDVAYDGIMAKDLLSGNKYDYIFFDCNMPGMSGIELVEVIKRTNPRSKKVMISGYGVINKDFADAVGIDMFLSKPIFVKDIERVVSNG